MQQLNESQASKFAETKTYEGTTYTTWDKETQNRDIEITEPRFIEDDLRTLCEFGLLSVKSTNNHTRIFNITRAGAKVGG